MIQFFKKTEILELEIEMTTLCNAQCPLCYRNYKSFSISKYNIKYIRPLNELIKQLDNFKHLKYVMMVGSLSEPTLYPYIFELIKYLKSRKIKIELCTNGDTHSSEWWYKLGKLFDLNDSVYFTICGSTQELHEHYRVNTNLLNIINNATYLRKAIPIDYAQCIRFNYNSDDFDTLQFKAIVSKFTHIYMTETFFPKDIYNYIKINNIFDFYPNKYKLEKYIKIKKLADNKFKSNNKGHAICLSQQLKRYQLDVFGNIYPCYLFLEYMNGNIWNLDITKIIQLQYECCKYCESFIYKYCKKNRLDYLI